jgi:PUA domain protein
MFKKYSKHSFGTISSLNKTSSRFSSADISGQTVVKSSVQRSIRTSILSQWNIDPETLDAIWPKKEGLMHVKCRDHISIFTCHGEPLFFQHFDGPFYPTLRILHQCQCLQSPEDTLTEGTVDPKVIPKVQVDRGAIRFLLSGANMMCPGMTSRGGWLPPAESTIPANHPVAIHAEGKESAAGIGLTKMTSEEIKSVNKGVGIELITHIGDDLWNTKKLGS